MSKLYDVAIIGGGPGGSVAAASLKQAGIKDVCIIEQAEFPRFQIGESLLPASIPIFRAIGFMPKLDNGNYIRKYGARFYSIQTEEDIYFRFSEANKEELNFAFEVPRSHFDNDLLTHAKENGAEVFQPLKVNEVRYEKDSCSLHTDQKMIRSRYLLDATGRSSFLAARSQGRVTNLDFNNLGVFGHWRGIRRYEGDHEGDITITMLAKGAWSWIIPFKGDVCSAGVVFSSKHYPGQKPNEEFFRKQIASCRKLHEMMKDANPIEELRTVSNYSQYSKDFFGDRWMMIGDAAAFLDPIFSSGVHLSMSFARKSSECLVKALKESRPLSDFGDEYTQHMKRGMNRFRSIISMFYQGDFVQQMVKTLQRPNLNQWFTAVVAGDVWDENNPLFDRKIL